MCICIYVYIYMCIYIHDKINLQILISIWQVIAIALYYYSTQQISLAYA